MTLGRATAPVSKRAILRRIGHWQGTNVTAASEFRAANLPRGQLLEGLKPREIDLVLSAAKSRWFRAKSVMTYQGDPVTHVLLLWKGRARYFYETRHGKKLIMRWIVPGQVFAGAALVSRPSAYLLSTEAIRDCVVLAWDGSVIRALARRFPQILENALTGALDRISWYIATCATLATETAKQKLANILIKLASSIGRTVSSGIEIDISNEELANSVNISLYTTSRIISEWRKTGAICKRRGKIFLPSPQEFFLRFA
jgi:CRP-like cAMP-binding protein